MWTHPNPIFAAVGLAGSGKDGVFGKALKDRMREYRDSRILQFEVYGEFLPTPGTYVTVEPGVKDKYGLPVAAITLDRHPMDFAATRFLVERGEEVLMRLDPDDDEARGHRRGDDHPPARHLPLRQRPGHLRARQGLPRPRGEQPLCGGRQLHAQRWQRPLHADHRRQQLPRGLQPDPEAQERVSSRRP